MTQEEKAKAYDEALKVLHKYDGANIMFTQDLKEEMFPELKESDDERIRKALIKFFTLSDDNADYQCCGVHYKDIVAYLEKQGKKTKPIEGFNTEFERQVSCLIASAMNRDYEYTKDFVKWTSDALLNYAKLEIEKNNMGISEATKKKLEDNLNNALEKETPESWNEFLEKQGEQKSQRTISAEAKEALFDYENANIKQKDFAPNDEQKPTDKVEPKFCEGEWITNGDYTWKIVEVNPLDYILQSQDGNIVDDTISHVDEQFHSFTIQDAKDGDVLSYVTDEDLWIMIYRSLYEPYEGHVHYHALLVNDNFSDKGTCCICIDNLKPATKEQRDLLFSKMKEAGYEWDADRLELKKIEQKPAWSEEDEDILNTIINHFKVNVECTDDDDIIKWLKSLKDRVQPQNTWKPSDEQMDALHYVTNFDYGGHKATLVSLYEQLKKLK